MCSPGRTPWAGRAAARGAPAPSGGGHGVQHGAELGRSGCAIALRYAPGPILEAQRAQGHAQSVPRAGLVSSRPAEALADRARLGSGMGKRKAAVRAAAQGAGGTPAPSAPTPAPEPPLSAAALSLLSDEGEEGRQRQGGPALPPLARRRRHCGCRHLPARPPAAHPPGIVTERLNELLDSIRCRGVLARLRAQGYSEHVAQVGGRCGAPHAGGCCLMSHKSSRLRPYGCWPPAPMLATVLVVCTQRACLEVHLTKREVTVESAQKWIRCARLRLGRWGGWGGCHAACRPGCPGLWMSCRGIRGCSWVLQRLTLAVSPLSGHPRLPQAPRRDQT